MKWLFLGTRLMFWRENFSHSFFLLFFLSLLLGVVTECPSFFLSSFLPSSLFLLFIFFSKDLLVVGLDCFCLKEIQEDN
jgi:hypothetical protein